MCKGLKPIAQGAAVVAKIKKKAATLNTQLLNYSTTQLLNCSTAIHGRPTLNMAPSAGLKPATR